MDRKLASIQLIKNLQPIEGKDRIELATIEGWNVVVQKGSFKIGQKCVYFEIDSILPDIPVFDFLRGRCYSPKFQGFRIKTMKLGAVYSQGICFPLEILNGYCEFPDRLSVGDDITEILKVRKYELVDSGETGTNVVRKKKWFAIRWLYRYGILKGESKQTRQWPEFLVKTDEQRIQNIPEVLEYIKGKELYITAKVDGSSGTMYCKKQKFGMQYFGACSRNMEVYPQNKQFHRTLKEAGNIYWKATYQYKLDKELPKWCKFYKRQIAVQGEIVGEGIQGNRHKIKGLDFYVFQIFDIDVRKYLDVGEMLGICRELNLKYVPFVSAQGSIDEYADINWWIKKSSQKINIGTEETLAEGIVVRTISEQYLHGLETIMNRISFKVISPEYLVLHDA